jgi:hypothetical protein
MTNLNKVSEEFGANSFTVSDAADLLESPNSYWIIKGMLRDGKITEISKSTYVINNKAAA